ncbi:hypothetical protein HS041_12305 [Planomonospora sp. ID67723]|uniref:hypothetical protein n=1 Tax=Planomonospora sp. ID67723 TaxID=2738134 RepID=UPI0018C3D3C1|nr:hypothetical protein [Planomonospora sp. ID67723]MBG0828551.1 hypothetical protein [Planomonospora sp. ID67723]
MASLASQADAARYGYSLPSGQEEAMLARATARVRRAAGQQITSTTSTVRLPVDGGVVTLPGAPITAVTTIEKLAADGGDEITDWEWDGRDRVTCVAWYKDVNVTYTHGLATVPEELIELVCAIAARLGTSTGGGMETGVRSEQIDDYSVTYASDALETASGLLPGEEAQLRAFLGDPPSAYAVRVRPSAVATSTWYWGCGYR